MQQAIYLRGRDPGIEEIGDQSRDIALLLSVYDSRAVRSIPRVWCVGNARAIGGSDAEEHAQAFVGVEHVATAIAARSEKEIGWVIHLERRARIRWIGSSLTRFLRETGITSSICTEFRQPRTLHRSKPGGDAPAPSNNVAGLFGLRRCKWLWWCGAGYFRQTGRDVVL